MPSTPNRLGGFSIPQRLSFASYRRGLAGTAPTTECASLVCLQRLVYQGKRERRAFGWNAF
jgi:hypothetical protein